MIYMGLLGSLGKMGKNIEPLLNKNGFIMSYCPIRGEALTDPDPRLEIIIDFSSPDFCLENLELMTRKNKTLKWVIGSTGWTDAQTQHLQSFSKNQIILKSSNFSIGILLVRKALKSISEQFLNSHFKVSLSETHHLHKKDAPSGTALLIKETIAPFLGVKELEIESKREGDVIGFHEVTFDSSLETVKISHNAKDRSVFAEGALYCAKEFLAFSSLESKIFTLDDLFSLKKSVL